MNPLKDLVDGMRVPVEPQFVVKFAAWEHMKMLADRVRVECFKSAIAYHSNANKVFCELGCGTGVFAIAAASAYKKVIAVDSDPMILEVARWNAARHGVSDKIDFIQADATAIGTDIISSKVDVLLSETLSTWLLREPLVPIMNNAWRCLLAENAAVIPLGVSNHIELGYTSFDFEGIVVRGISPELAGVSQPRISTRAAMVQDILFNQPVSLETSGEVTLDAICEGPVNLARITSVAHLAPGIGISSRDTLMPAFHVPLREEIGPLKRESRVGVTWRGTFGGGLETLDIVAKSNLSDAS